MVAAVAARRLMALARHVAPPATQKHASRGNAGADPLSAATEYLQGIVSGSPAGGRAGLAIQVVCRGEVVLAAGFGSYEPSNAVDAACPRASVTPDTIFLVASLTKPVTATAVMQLVEQKLLSLETPLHTVIPEFAPVSGDQEGWRRSITIRHLLTHTSGLPDAFPDNRALRVRHATLAEFVENSLATSQLLEFEPGTNISYQSVGLLLLGEVVQRVSGLSLPEYLDLHVFKVLGMNDTTLGARRQQHREAKSNLDIETEYMATNNIGGESDQDWDWNSDFWRSLGAPWGGLLTTVEDVSR